MREPPVGVDDDDVRAVVRAQWLPDATTVEHLAVGFGAHHWVACQGRERRLFVTVDSLDGLGGRHDAASLEATYAAAAELAIRLEFVAPSLVSAAGTFTVPLAERRVSATAWIDGVRPPDASGALPLVRRLHAAEPPAGVRRWEPLVSPSLAGELATRLRVPWTAGPFAAAAQEALIPRITAIEAWTATYDRLVAEARERRWVATHGEPHERNQLLTEEGLVLVDWETLLLAPAERDLRVLPAADADPAMLELFDLEWRLDEIASFSAWLEAPHSGTESDRVALGGLRHELDRPEWSPP